MTHKDIYTKFMIEYDKANVTSSYPSLTEYEVATVLDKAYNALIAQKVTGNNVRRVALEGDLKNVIDLYPLIVKDATKKLEKIDNVNVGKRELPKDMLYFISGRLIHNSLEHLEGAAMDGVMERPLPVKLVSHDIADKFIISSYNLPWIKTPVCYIENDNIYVVYDPINIPEMNDEYKMGVTYIKVPNRFAKNIDTKYLMDEVVADDNVFALLEDVSYFKYTVKKSNDPLYSYEENEELKSILDKYYEFECNDTVAEELISLAVAFALENVESQRLNSKLNMRGLEA